MKTPIASIVTFGLVGASLASAGHGSPKRSPASPQDQLDDPSTKIINDDALKIGHLPEVHGDSHIVVLQKRATSVSPSIRVCGWGGWVYAARRARPKEGRRAFFATARAPTWRAAWGRAAATE